MIAGIAVVSHPPLVVPELVTGKSGETAQVRTATLRAVTELAGFSHDWVAVAAGSPAASLIPPLTGSFRGFGVDRRVSLDGSESEPAPSLPLPALIAGWLREQAGANRVEVELVDAATDHAAVGERLRTRPVGLLIMADGSARHAPKCPGPVDDRAPGYDADIANLLATADHAALRELDKGLAEELWATGWPALRVLGSAAEGRDWDAELLYSAAPYGIGYQVAVWRPC
ncbi:hypothetical protein D5S17_12415 [Pseudonocardiaceae bacterium YIM PH 21723]|nr:hypothetical protein D5S17_12415 [Pseudonocardiaceae bacterium YIM PH 21723]